MKKILDFLFHIFRPRHKCKFITADGVMVVITCNYGREAQFARLIHSIYPEIVLDDFRADRGRDLGNPED